MARDIAAQTELTRLRDDCGTRYDNQAKQKHEDLMFEVLLNAILGFS